jgi:hypothetical protein
MGANSIRTIAYSGMRKSTPAMPDSVEPCPNDGMAMRRSAHSVVIAGKDFGSYRGWSCARCAYTSFSNATYLSIVRSARPRGINWDTVEDWYEGHIRGSWFAQMDALIERSKRPGGSRTYQEVFGKPPPPGKYQIVFTTEALRGLTRAPKGVQRSIRRAVERLSNDPTGSGA